MPAGTAAVENLQQAFTDLRAALEANDPSAIFEASRKVRSATADVRAHGAWRQDPVLHEKIKTIIPLIEAARIRVNVASDHVRQRISLLADYGSDGAKITYGR